MKKISRTLENVTPSKAEQFLAFNNFRSQRAMRPAHVDELTDKMISGDFRFGEIATAHNGTEEKYLMNGQHVCQAIVQFGKPVPCVIETFECADELEFSHLFRQFEILNRSIGDMIKVEADALHLDWPPSISSLVVSAVSLIEKPLKSMSSKPTPGSLGTFKAGMSKEEKVMLLRNYIVEGEFIRFILTESNGKKLNSVPQSYRHLTRAPVVGSMIMTFKKNTKDSEQFWLDVRDGEELLKIMPQYKLRDFLLTASSIEGRGRFSYRKVTNHEYFYKCITAWNAFRSGSTTQLRYYGPGKTIPKAK